MTDRHDVWSTTPYPEAPQARALPGQMPRPVYREPHPVQAGPLIAGFGATVLWFVLFGALGRDLASYAWWTLLAAVVAWAVALILARLGDRGVAVGVALAGSLGLSCAAAFVAVRWITTYDWPLW